MQQRSLFEDAIQPPVSMEAELHERYSFLVGELTQLNREYYEDDAPTQSDAVYDNLMQELRAIEADHPDWVLANSPSKIVGGKSASKFTKFNYQVPMQSLQDVFKQEDVNTFVNQVKLTFPDATFVVEQKIDGLSLGVRYRFGKLERAWTRGDGVSVGEDITVNALQIGTVPKQIETDLELVEIRGEVYMSNHSFAQVNQQRRDDGEEEFANPRNCAAGTLRQLDPAIVRERNLAFFAFNVQQHSGEAFQNHAESMTFLRKIGFTTVPQLELVSDAAGVWQLIAQINEMRSSLDYGIDGAVVKVNELNLREQMGATSKCPRWAVAYKYKPESTTTVVKSIEVQIGRTGRITPLAHLKPVLLAGSTISKATLHNQGIIDALDLRIGDTVEIIKSGDIIPSVVSVVLPKRPVGTTPYTIPTNCPSCGIPLEQSDTEVEIFCPNQQCHARLLAHLKYFVGGNAMDIKGIGGKTLERLVESGYVKDIADLYYLGQYRAELIKTQRVKLNPTKANQIKETRGKSVDAMLAGIEQSKSVALERLLIGLGISHVGRKAAETLAKVIADITDLYTIDESYLLAQDGIGSEIAQAIATYFSSQENQQMIVRLREAGLNLSGTKDQVRNISTIMPLSGQVFAITGTFIDLKYKRQVLSNLLRDLGGTVENAVTNKTTILIHGKNVGSKLEKALAKGIELWDEARLVQELKLHFPDHLV